MVKKGLTMVKYPKVRRSTISLCLPNWPTWLWMMGAFQERYDMPSLEAASKLSFKDELRMKA
jgi:hypothetical protein